MSPPPGWLYVGPLCTPLCMPLSTPHDWHHLRTLILPVLCCYLWLQHPQSYQLLCSIPEFLIVSHSVPSYWERFEEKARWRKKLRQHGTQSTQKCEQEGINMACWVEILSMWIGSSPTKSYRTCIFTVVIDYLLPNSHLLEVTNFLEGPEPPWSTRLKARCAEWHYNCVPWPLYWRNSGGPKSEGLELKREKNHVPLEWRRIWHNIKLIAL